MFSRFAKWMSAILGNSIAFTSALTIVILWLISGPFFHYSDSWEIVINTITTIITFLMVFLLQNSQNRDTIAIHLKLDEIIRSQNNAHNSLLKIEELDDEDLESLLKKYENLAQDVKKCMKNGEGDKEIKDIKA